MLQREADDDTKRKQDEQESAVRNAEAALEIMLAKEERSAPRPHGSGGSGRRRHNMHRKSSGRGERDAPAHVRSDADAKIAVLKCRRRSSGAGMERSHHPGGMTQAARSEIVVDVRASAAVVAWHSLVASRPPRKSQDAPQSQNVKNILHTSWIIVFVLADNAW